MSALTLGLITAGLLVAVEGTPALAAVDQVIGEIRLQSTAYCADLPSNNTANGTQFQVYDCHGGSGQNFTVESDSTIQISGKCLDAKSSGTTAGTVVQIYTCNGTNAQKWVAELNNGIKGQVRYRNVNSNLYLSLAGDAGNGTKLVLGAGAVWKPPAVQNWRLAGTSTSPDCYNGVTFPAETVRTTHGTVADFNGNNQYCAADAATTGPIVDVAHSFSVAAWVKLKPFAGLGNLTAVSQDGNRVSSFFLGYDAASGKWSFRMPSNDADTPGSWTVVVPATGVATEAWTHLVGAYDSNTNRASLYVNGLLAGAITVTNPLFTSPIDGLVIGRGKWQGNNADHWLGRISNVRSWTYPLTATEANQVYFDGAVSPTCQANHCYALVHANDPGLDAAAADLLINCLSNDSGFTTNEMWFPTTAQPDGGWVEVGQIYGFASGSTRTDLRWFWGDYRGSAAGGFYQHVIENGETGSQRHVSIYSQGGGSYTVNLSGNLVGTSTGNGAPGGRADYGSESYLQKPYISSYVSNWQYRKNGAWIHPAPNISVEAPPYHPWVGSDGKFNIVSNVGCTGAPTAAAALTAAAPVDTDGAIAIAKAFAAANNDRHPVAAEVVRTKRLAAMRTLSGDAVNTDADVFVVRLRGDFRATRFSVPAGHAIPTGTVLTVTVDAATGEMTDWSLGGDTKPLTALGAVTNRVL